MPDSIKQAIISILSATAFDHQDLHIHPYRPLTYRAESRFTLFLPMIPRGSALISPLPPLPCGYVSPINHANCAPEPLYYSLH